MQFITFGCWNAPHVESPQVINTLRSLENYLSIESNRENTLFIAVLGDNYYPPKDKSKDKLKDKPTDEAEKKPKDKVKPIDVEAIHSAFMKLLEVAGTIPVFVIYGNHDLEDNKVTCVQLREQQTFSSPTNHFYNNLMFYETDNDLFIFIDTTIYSYPKEDIIPEENCYKYLDIYNSVLTSKGIDKTQISYGDIRDYQEEAIINVINTRDSEKRKIVKNIWSRTNSKL